MDGMKEIEALNAEARRRGTSYGKLVAALSWEERREIVRRYQRAREAREKRKGKRGPAG